MSDFATFCNQQHEKRVTHFVNYCQSENRDPSIEDAMEIFGFSAEECGPIVDAAGERMSGGDL